VLRDLYPFIDDMNGNAGVGLRDGDFLVQIDDLGGVRRLQRNISGRGIISVIKERDQIAWNKDSKLAAKNDGLRFSRSAQLGFNNSGITDR
jgi:hypothetical protein